MEKLKMQSPNLTNQNLEKIKMIFPNCITESLDASGNLTLAIDFDLLKQELSSNIIEGQQERYQLNWPGKKQAFLTANAPIAKTLRPALQESVDFDNTKNLFIEGDNLEALKLLQETYLSKVKMIYIDPPYNTGKDFIYRDNFTEKTTDFLQKSSQIDADGNRLTANTESNGRFHSDWLSFIYPRLRLAKNLLSDDGVIFISIDDNEQANLKRLCDEIFGEENFVGQMQRKTTEHVRVLSDYELQKLNDYILIYAKKIDHTNFNKKITGAVKYEFKDEIGEYTLKSFQNSGADGTRLARPKLYYPIFINLESNLMSLEKKDGYIEILPKKVMKKDGRWLWSKEKFEQDNHLLEYKNGTIYRKYYYDKQEDQNKYQAEKLWLDCFQNRLGAKDLTELNLQGFFDYPKPTQLIKHILQISTSPNDLILDFFAGSGTTAHALMQLNAEDGGNRKFIMVQLPEKCDEKSESYKAGYKNIAEISKERIRRAGKKILEGNCHEGWNKDVGFRVLKIDSSNMNEIYYTPNNTNQNDLFSAVDNIKQDRSALDLLFQVLLDLGVDLTLPISQKTICGKTIFAVNEDKILGETKIDLVACFDLNIGEDLIYELAKTKPLKVVFRDNGFASDAIKINVCQIFKQISPDTIVKSI